MSTIPQSYAKHRRLVPSWHFFALPVLLINVIVTVVHLVRTPSFGAAWDIVVAAALVVAVVASRWMSVRLQDRLIREEERTRLMRLLPSAEHAAVDTLTVDQLVGLRFAPDRELAALVTRCVAGELTTRDAVKRAVVEWRPDHLRV